MHTYNPSIREVEAGGLGSQGQSQKKKEEERRRRRRKKETEERRGGEEEAERKQSNSAIQDVGEEERLLTAGGDINWRSYYRSQCGGSSKTLKNTCIAMFTNAFFHDS